MQGIYRLKGTVKNYDWGGFSFIPSLLNENNPSKQPFAEYWMGIHPLGHSMIEEAEGAWIPLNNLAPELPYLLKILDVRNMLSIQVHPTRQAAGKGFEEENAAGIPADAPARNYKDANHKPELVVALSDFWLLHGFKPQEELVYTLLNVVELRELLPVFNETGYAGLYRHIMEMPQEDVNRILQPLINNLAAIYKDNKPERDDEDYWVAKAHHTFNKGGHIDRGIFSIFLFNLVHLKKGEGLFQDAGVPHAYLEGQCVEIMSNSDNVLRGGLTSKHIDVPELLKHVRCEATFPDILQGEKKGDERIFRTTTPDFQLSCFELESGETVSFTPVTHEIIVLTEGIVEADDDNRAVRLQVGEPCAFVAGDQPIYLAAAAKSAVFRASMPV